MVDHFQPEVSWTISDENGEELLSGGAPYTGGIGGEDCIYEGYQNENENQIFECSGTLNDYVSSMESNSQGSGSFNLQLTISDGNCEISGCTNPTAFNYNPLANVDNGLCDLPINLGVLECGFDTIMSVETPQNPYYNSFEQSIYYTLEIENYSEIIIDLDGNNTWYKPIIFIYDATTGSRTHVIQYTSNYDINNYALNLNARKLLYSNKRILLLFWWIIA